MSPNCGYIKRQRTWSYYSLWNFNRNPTRFENLDNLDLNQEHIWPLIVIGIVTYLVWTEYGSQDCRHQNCNNRAEIIYPEDSISEIIKKISSYLSINHAIVEWRRSLLVAIAIGLIVLFIFCPYFPDGFTVLVTIFLIFFVVHFSSVWLSTHWWKTNDDKIERSLRNLRNKQLN